MRSKVRLHPGARGVGSLTTKLALTLLLIGLFGSGITGTLAIFTATIDNTGNTFSTGTVTLTDNDAGTAMLGLTNAKPGDTDTSCIQVSYTGSLPSTVRLYGTTTGSGLDPYLNLTVTRGTGSTFDDCSAFAADAVDYGGGGNGVVYNGTVQGFPDDYTGALVDPTAGSPETWTTDETHDYRFTVTVADSDSGQGKSASQTFIWEARNN